MSLTTIGATLARSSAMAPPVQRARALMLAGMRPKEGPIWRQLERSGRIRWLQVRMARRPAGKRMVNNGVRGEASLRQRCCTQRQTACMGDRRGSPVSSWVMLLFLSPFFWVMKLRLTRTAERREAPLVAAAINAGSRAWDFEGGVTERGGSPATLSIDKQCVL
jgi:hypothetical protein